MIPPPTSHLPPIARIATSTSAQLSDALRYLHLLYLPQVRGSRRRPRQDQPPSCPISSCGHAEDVQFDAFERAYAIRWLTALITQLEARLEARSPPSGHADADRLIQQAASLLATCAGVAAAGRVQRRFTFPSTPVAGEVHVALTDIPLDNHDYASVGAQTWGGACVLAEMIAERPGQFGLGAARGPLRVLELGAGTGLVGLTVAQLLLLQAPPPSPTGDHRATVVLTDFYPAVLDNLQSNIDANFPIVSDDIAVVAHPLDWSSFSTTVPKPDILSSPFDVVFGADIVYEAQHAVWIRDCLRSLLSRPRISSEEPVFHLLVPLRPTHTSESSTVEAVFGSGDHASQPELTILSKESILCEAYGHGRSGRGRADDDVEYVYYRIGWTQRPEQHA